MQESTGHRDFYNRLHSGSSLVSNSQFLLPHAEQTVGLSILPRILLWSMIPLMVQERAYIFYKIQFLHWGH